MSGGKIKLEKKYYLSSEQLLKLKEKGWRVTSEEIEEAIARERKLKQVPHESGFDLEELVEAYDNDWRWLVKLNKQVFTNKRLSVDIKSKAHNILEILSKLNYVRIQTETNASVSEYNGEIQELYSKIKLDLTTLLGINDFWNMI